MGVRMKKSLAENQLSCQYGSRRCGRCSNLQTLGPGVKNLQLTDEIQARIAIVTGARALGDASLLDQAKCELADELLRAIVTQSARLARLPRRARLVDVVLTPKRRARRA
jgi:hypothetical protein